MRKVFGLFAALAVLISFASPLLAHPPSDIEMKYDKATQTANIVVTHPVSNPKTHFIKEVEIWANGKMFKRIMYLEQKTPRAQIQEVKIPGLKAGDKIDIEAECNLSGELKKEFKIE